MKQQSQKQTSMTSDKLKAYQKEKDIQDERVVSALRASQVELEEDSQGALSRKRSYQKFEPTAGLKEIVQDKLSKFKRQVEEKSLERSFGKYKHVTSKDCQKDGSKGNSLVVQQPEYSPFRDSMNESGLLMSGAIVTLKNIKNVGVDEAVTNLDTGGKEELALDMSPQISFKNHNTSKDKDYYIESNNDTGRFAANKLGSAELLKQ